MNKSFLLLFVFAAIILFNGCASMSQPKRTAYTGADNIGTIKPEMLIGNWNVRVLNPIEGEAAQKVSANYRQDGTMVMNAIPQASDSPMGTMVLEMIGTWTIEGENIVARLDSMRETSGNKMASLIVGMLGNMKKKLSGTANIYQASADRVVLVSTDGQAQELTRIR